MAEESGRATVHGVASVGHELVTEPPPSTNIYPTFV